MTDVRVLYEQIDAMAPRIASVMGPPYAPVPKMVVYETYGCGHFGCVLPTDRANLVLKVTTDPHEAMAAAILAEAGEKRGVVRYHKVLWVPDRGRRQMKIRELRELKLWKTVPGVFLLWREAADFKRVALKKSPAKYLYDAREAVRKIGESTFGQRQQLWKDVAPGLESPEGGTRERLFWKWFRYVNAVESAGKTKEIRSMSDAMLDWSEQWGLLLGDVHQDNVAFAVRGGKKVPVITDPGVSVLLGPDWDKLSIEAL